MWNDLDYSHTGTAMALPATVATKWPMAMASTLAAPVLVIIPKAKEVSTLVC